MIRSTEALGLAGALALTAVLTAASPASAADLPRRVAPPPAFTPVPVFTWTGFYAGVNAGAGFGGGGGTFTDATYGTVTPASRDAAFVGGGQIGYNYQLTPGSGFVLGVEADIQGTTFGRARSGLVGSTTFYDVGPSLDWFGTVRGRIGYAFDRFLVYGTGGFAYGGGSTPANASYYTGTLPDTFRTGWTAGGGVEYAITERLSARIEALYVSLDRNGGSGGLVYDTATNAYYGLGKPKADFGVVRAGLNYRFSTD
ncbi:outer membrane immunogenic protein [Methylobacterium sp. 174MFSha1.1]|uniref:outer membrane protein n=1 Tax=Methylobacterium sp. 174MFSha1.1 TaxID=1502749 RepID=UPI0008ED40A2|nr:outer membrane beta-barrel protein [Methylobacterium sp. 174MFSha1.1]SFU71382.1 outer membrane immunogenic protein [Methylobacterium sp. 174MFSha1.1]